MFYKPEKNRTFLALFAMHLQFWGMSTFGAISLALVDKEKNWADTYLDISQ